MEQCRGECLFGKCPYPACIKYRSAGKAGTVKRSGMKILTETGLPEHCADKRGIGAAVDIGTTTVAVYLYDLASSRQLAVTSEINAQTSLGVDVISRIKLCGDHADGLSILHDAISKQLVRMLGEVSKKAGVNPQDIHNSVVTGNTTMLHLLQGISPVSMGVLPFEPQSRFGYTVGMEELDIPLPSKCYLPPCISAFVGADIVTGMLATGFAEADRELLLMDIGTNGEVALGNALSVAATSTAAGPAFEGAQISCGMAGVTGAINAVDIAEGKLRYTTIGDVAPCGICGSGLLDTIAVLLRTGAIDETGKMNDEAPIYVDRDGEGAFEIAKGIFLTQKDIREFQTAKAAVAAGVLALMHDRGVCEQAIQTVFIAGGFGNYMNMDSAREVGLIPPEIPVKSVGNAAASGAALLLLDDSFRLKAEKIQAVSEHLELGGDPYFMEQYINCMCFE